MLRTGDEPIVGYRLDNFLGRGQFGDVWKAQAPGGKLVALKFINIVGKQGLKEYQAIQKVKNIQHPHLMPIIAFWILDQEQNVLSDEVLEQIDLSSQGKEVDIRKTQMGEEPMPTTLVVAMLLGEASLNDYFEQCREEGKDGIPVEQLLDYMEEAAKGIDFLNRPCHDLGEGPVAIQHCDIKPHNMLLTGGAVQICDFGLARVLEDVRQTRSVAGTPAYIAPESISGRRPSSSTDQYSLAITYYEMRTGDLPFRAEDRTSQMAIMQAHMKGQLEFDLSEPFEADVLRKATAVDPEARYPTSLAMVRALRRAVEQQQRGPVDAKGTMVTGDHIAPESADMSNADVFHQTEVTDVVTPSARTIDSMPLDGTMQVSPTQVEQLEQQSLPSETVADAAQTTVEDQEAQPTRQDFRQAKKSSGAMVPLVVIGLLLLAAAGGGGFVWWNSQQSGGNGGGGGGDTPTAHEVTFVPADVEVTIRGETVSLSNGMVEVKKPDAGRLDLKVAHASGHYEPKTLFSWAELESLDYKIELERNAEGYVAASWQALDDGDFDQAVAEFARAKDLKRSVALNVAPPELLRGHADRIIDIAVDGSGQYLASASDDDNGKNLFVWQLSPDQPTTKIELPGHGTIVEAVAFSPDGKWLATGSRIPFDAAPDASGELNLWRLGEFDKGYIKLEGFEGDVKKLQFDFKSRYLVATTRGGYVPIWEINVQNQSVTPTFLYDDDLEGFKPEIKALAIIPGSYHVITGDMNGNVYSWQLPPPGTGGVVEPVEMKYDPPHSDIGVVAVDPLGKWVAAGTGSSMVLWNIDRPDDGYAVVVERRAMNALAFSPDSTQVAVGDHGGQVFLPTLPDNDDPMGVTNRPPLSIPGVDGQRANTGEILALAFSPDGRWLAVSGGDNLIRIWDMTKPTDPPAILSGHNKSIPGPGDVDHANKIRHLIFTPYDHRLISASDDGTIGVWDYRKWLVIDRALRMESAPNVPNTVASREREVLLPLASGL